MRNVLLLAGLILSLGTTSARAETVTMTKYRVTVVNLTRGQGFSPPVLAVSNKHIPFFEVGKPATAGIAAIAEDGIQMTLANEIKARVPGVQVVLGQGGIAPGKNASFIVNGSWYSRISVAAMLGSTNDAFLALNDVALMPGILMVPAYDAGSEANNESCVYVPGPPCAAHNVRMPEGAEGYVHIHAGISGSTDLNRAQLDWRNPVAKIVIEKLR